MVLSTTEVCLQTNISLQMLYRSLALHIDIIECCTEKYLPSIISFVYRRVLFILHYVISLLVDSTKLFFHQYSYLILFVLNLSTQNERHRPQRRSLYRQLRSQRNNSMRMLNISQWINNKNGQKNLSKIQDKRIQFTEMPHICKLQDERIQQGDTHIANCTFSRSHNDSVSNKFNCQLPWFQ